MSKYNNKRRQLNDLEAIYKDYDARFKKGGSSLGKIIIFALFFIGVIALAVFAGYYVFHEKISDEFKSDDMAFEIKGNESVISGEEIFYIIKYQNNSAVAASDCEINFSYPDGFILEMTDPKPLKEEKSRNIMWHFEKIGEGDGGEIKLKGIIVGNIGDEKKFNANFKYTPINTGARFMKRADVATIIENKYLSLDIAGDGNFIEGDKNKLTVKYKNNSATSLKNLKLISYFPKSAEFLAGNNLMKFSDTEGETSRYEMKIEELKGKIEETVDMDIAVNSKDYGASFKFQIGYLDSQGKFFMQDEEIYNVVISKGALETTLIINGNNDKGYANFGDVLNYSLILKNSGDIKFSDIEPRIIIDDSENLLNWDSLITKEGGKLSDNEILWNKENNSKLAELNKGEEIELSFSIELKKKTVGEVGDIIDGGILSWAEIRTGKIGNLGEEKDFKTKLVSINLNTDLELTTKLRYFNDNGEAIGSGPLPPKVGEETKYKIYWELSNSINEIKNVKIESRLPDDVEWKEKISLDSGELYYNQEKRSVIWTIPKLPKNLSDVIKGVFEISIEPQIKDAGSTMILMDNISLEGIDTKTGAKLSKVYGFITTFDEAIGGMGTVAE
ncbi:MAG: hypothetical protein V1891_05045 [bacterium]